VLFENLRQRGDGRILLADRDVDTEHVAAALVDDRVDRDRGLAGRAVANDQLALTLADRDQRVDRANPRLQRLIDREALNHRRRRVLDRAVFLGLDRAFAVNWIAERNDHASEQLLAYRHR